MFIRQFALSFLLALLFVAITADAAPVPKVSPYVTEISRAYEAARFRLRDEISSMVARIPELVNPKPEEPPKDNILLARSMEDTVFVSARGATPGTPQALNQIVGTREGSSSSEVFNFTA